MPFKWGMDKQTMVQYIMVYRNELLIYALIQKNFKNIVLNEISQTEKAAYCVIPFMTFLQKQTQKDGNQMGGCEWTKKGRRA